MVRAQAFLSLALAATRVLAQTNTPITVTVSISPTPLITCGTANVYWTTALASANENITQALTAIESTSIGLWVQSTSPFNPASINVTDVGRGLQPPNGLMMTTWSPITLPPNSGEWILYLRSLPGHVGGLDVAAQSDPFVVASGVTEACLAPLAASSSASVASTATSSSMEVTSSTSSTLAATAAAVHSGGSSHAGKIAGAVLGTVLGLAILIFLCFAWAMHRRKQRRRQEAAARKGRTAPTPSTLDDREKTDPETGLGKYGGLLAAIGITAHNSHPTTTHNGTAGTTSPVSTLPATLPTSEAGPKNLTVKTGPVAAVAATNRYSQASGTTVGSLQQFPQPPNSPTSLGGSAEARRASMRGSWTGPSPAAAMSSSGAKPPSPTGTSSSETHTGAVSGAAAGAAAGAPLARSNTGGTKVQRKAPPQIPEGLKPTTPSASTFPEFTNTPPSPPPFNQGPAPGPSAFFNASGVKVGAPSISTASFHTAQGPESSRPSVEIERGHDGRTLARTGHGGGFAAHENFPGAKEGPVHYLIPDMPRARSP